VSAYYNEFDPFAAAWLRELIKDGLIADGEVDERSIADVQPSDIKGFTQCHFFAGIGGWSAAARLAGWGDDRPMWSGSPPCQPFSTAGNRKGQDDERHLWPVFFNLIRECRPSVVFGEQVAAAIRTGWFDDLQTDMEAEGYATAMVVLPACSVGAPHKRDRLWTVAERLGNAKYNGSHGAQIGRSVTETGDNSEKWSYIPSKSQGASRPAQSGDICDQADTRSMADTNAHRRQQSVQQIQGESPERLGCDSIDSRGVKLGDANCEGLQEHRKPGELYFWESNWENKNRQRINAGLSSGFWSDNRLVYCRDGKARQIPTEPALFPLANGIPNRVGILRGAGNAIVPQVAAEVIGAYMEVCK
jgi:DNA (cytosine-5)-methyltransferase 1